LAIPVSASWSAPSFREWHGPTKCGGNSPRSFERDFPILESLGLLVWDGRGFRLPQFVGKSTQIVGRAHDVEDFHARIH
jgi:hypothetical protein